jgi:hypothetical protein
MSKTAKQILVNLTSMRHTIVKAGLARHQTTFDVAGSQHTA